MCLVDISIHMCALMNVYTCILINESVVSLGKCSIIYWFAYNKTEMCCFCNQLNNIAINNFNPRDTNLMCWHFHVTLSSVYFCTMHSGVVFVYRKTTVLRKTMRVEIRYLITLIHIEIYIKYNQIVIEK